MAPRPIGWGPGEKPAPGDDLAQAERFRTLVERARRQPPLRAGEQEALIEQAAAGSTPARQRLFDSQVQMLVGRGAAHRDQGLSLEDLVQEATVAFMAAIDAYAASGRGDFDAYAAERVDQGLESAVQAERSAVANTTRLLRDAGDFDRVQALLRRTLGRPATDPEVAEKLEWTAGRAGAVRGLVDHARRRHDEEILAYLEPRDSDGLPDAREG
ncbi:MAG TPA: hypothetical protein VK131_02100 [Candidatus Acidoferrales bacterium]|nr:hypothetical protein [Candidatus Acidoferrales bacterium]